MKPNFAYLITLIALGILMFGCSDDSDSLDQSTDDVISTDSDSSGYMGADSDADSSALVNDSDSLDSATSASGDTGQETDTAVPADTSDSPDTSILNDTANTEDTSALVDTASESDSGIAGTDTASSVPDTGTGADTPSDSDVDTGDTSDTGVDTTADTETESIVDTETETAPSTECPYTCRRENWCTFVDGIVHEAFECDEANQVCCETADTPEDTDDTETAADTGTDTSEDTDDNMCTVGCHSASWCNTNDAVVYEEKTCSGNQLCCEIVE